MGEVGDGYGYGGNGSDGGGGACGREGRGGGGRVDCAGAGSTNTSGRVKIQLQHGTVPVFCTMDSAAPLPPHFGFRRTSTELELQHGMGHLVALEWVC
jgi:hypothetical protein